MENTTTLFCKIIGFDWVAILKIAISIWAVSVATIALKTWKKQSKAEKQTSFLDELTENLHEFIECINEPVELLRYVKINIEAYQSINTPQETQPASIAYVKKNGSSDSARINKCLDKCAPSISRIKSLITKGQVLGFSDYNNCYISCKEIIEQHQKLRAFAIIIGGGNYNWSNPTVIETLSKAVLMEPDKIQEVLQTNYSNYLKFLKANYESVYK